MRPGGDFLPTLGREQRGRRPALIISYDTFSESAAGLVLLGPVPTTERPSLPWYVAVGPESGLPQRSFEMCEQVRSASTQRLFEGAGAAPAPVMQNVEDRLFVLMAF